jgi:hypothetical protein
MSNASMEMSLMEKSKQRPNTDYLKFALSKNEDEEAAHVVGSLTQTK